MRGGPRGIGDRTHPDQTRRDVCATRVALQMLINDVNQRHAGDPELLRESTAINQGLVPTETYAQQNEQIVNQELNSNSEE